MKLQFKRAFNTLIGKKSYSIEDILRITYGGNGDTFGKDLTDEEALTLYARVTAINTAVNLITDKFKTLEPVLWDKKEEKFIKNGSEGIKENEQALFDLLAEPNKDTLKDEFFKQMGSYYIPTGNLYIVGIGNITQPPKELNVIPSQYVEVKGSKLDGLASEYTIQSYGHKEIFKRSPKEFRFFSGDGREIWHIKTFNPFRSSDNLKGMSLFNADKSPALQIQEGDKHNFNSLKNGAFLGGLLSIDELSADQMQKVQSDFNSKHKGTENSNKVAIFGKKHEFTELGKSMRDMDFRNLINDKEKQIYNNLKIPLPLVSTEASTFNNFEEAQVKLWDNAILPLAKTMFQELTSFLVSRFKLENKIITYDENDIDDLAVRRNKELARKQKSGYFTDNELRTEEGMEQLTDGADAIYKPMNLVPVATDINKTNALTKPKPVKELTTRNKFIDLMQKQVDEKGNRKFTDEEIEELADKNELK